MLTIIQILDNGLVQFLVPSFMINNHNFWDQEPAKVNAEVLLALETFTVNNTSARFIIFLLGNPHGLEGCQGG